MEIIIRRTAAKYLRILYPEKLMKKTADSNEKGKISPAAYLEEIMWKKSLHITIINIMIRHIEKYTVFFLLRNRIHISTRARTNMNSFVDFGI